MIEVDKVEIESKNSLNPILMATNNIKLKIKNNSNQNNIYLGLILGDTSNIEDETKEEFRIASMAHILAISGMHISYLVIASTFIFNKIIGKRKAKIATSIVLVIYMLIVGFSPSVVRASLMAIILLFSFVFYRKNDLPTTIGISALIITIINPYSILDIGFQLSYIGAIGIILFRRPILMLLNKIKIKDRRIKYKIPKKIIFISEKLKELLSVILSAQITILPINLYHFNLFSSYFIITNVLISLIIGPVFIISLIYTLVLLTNSKLIFIFEKILNIGIGAITQISKIPNYLLGSKIYFPTPKIYQIIIYYLGISILFYILTLKNAKKLNMSQIRVLNLIALLKYRYRQINKKKRRMVIIIFLIVYFVFSIIPKDLEINFIDVGQGDSTLITTPNNKKILIDGGGSKNFDVGKYTLLPYILDKGYTNIDYAIISHFDEDHVGGILTILEELKVNKVIIPKQVESSEEYEKFLKIVHSKNIKVILAKKGDKIEIENDLYFLVMWPSEKPIEENSMNNNALVTKLIYKDFSCLFTGDIESVAEEELIKKGDSLKSTILKVAHHGSKTSSTEEFLKEVKPKVALIGVGEDNNYGHPNENVIQRIKKYTNKIYRTDLNGEINIKVRKKDYVLKSKKM